MELKFGILVQLLTLIQSILNPTTNKPSTNYTTTATSTTTTTVITPVIVSPLTGQSCQLTPEFDLMSSKTDYALYANTNEESDDFTLPGSS
jgi:hypothetical protein